MSTVLQVPCGADLAKMAQQIPPGTVLQLASGVWPGMVITGRRLPLTLQGDPTGGTRFAGSDAHGLKISDCAFVTLANLVFTESAFCGCQAVGSTDLHFLSCEAFANGRVREPGGQHGILTGGCSRVRFEDCRCHHQADGHGIYISEPGADITVTGCTCNANGRTGMQANGRPGQIHRLTVVGNDLTGNANVSLQLAGVVGGTVAGNRLGGGAHAYDVVVWDDAGGAAHACRDLDLRGQPGAIQVSADCSGILRAS